MSGRFCGVARHEVHLEAGVPVAVTLVLAGGAEVVYDPAARTLEQKSGEPLSPRRLEWLWGIGEFLLRQHLLEAGEKAQEERNAGRAELRFEPRPPPGVVWWG